MKGGKREGTEDSLITREKQMREFHYLWGKLDIEERKTYLLEFRGRQRLRIIYKFSHIILVPLFFSSILIATTSPNHFNDYIFSIMGGSVIALDFFALKWIGGKLIHR